MGALRSVYVDVGAVFGIHGVPGGAAGAGVGRQSKLFYILLYSNDEAVQGAYTLEEFHTKSGLSCISQEAGNESLEPHISRWPRVYIGGGMDKNQGALL